MIKAELIDHLGDDLRVVNAARVSMDKASDWVQRPLVDGPGHTIMLDEEVPASYEMWSDYPTAFDDKGRELSSFILSLSDSRLINYLARHQHFTPFTHCQITLRETVPIFVARQRFKHVVGFTYNEVSRRYVDSDPEFFRPAGFRGRAENVKQGSLDAILIHYPKTDPVSGYIHGVFPMLEYDELMETCLKVYREFIDGGICPEQARMVLPQSMMTSYYVTGSLMAFARAYKQRIDPHAQKEIRDLAVQWDTLIGPLFPDSWLALTRPHT